MLSVLILTLDEEVNIAGCIGSLPWREDVHVLDSDSGDGTATIARSMGAQVSVRKFDNYANQRNAGLNLPFRNEWIVMLDADERMTPELADEIESALCAAPANLTLMRVRRRDIFMGRWLKRSSGYPTWFPRILRRGKVMVEREINELYLSHGVSKQLRGHIDHYPFNKGIDWWFDRHNRYSSGEAKLLFNKERFDAKTWLVADPAVRRRAFKAFAYRLPARPFLMFLYLFIVRLGFLDGRAGFHFASMRMAYEIMIDAKVAFMCHNSTDASDR